MKGHFKLAVIGAAFLLAGGCLAGKNIKENYQEDIAGKIVRFHVLANSDTKEDQQLKLEVKDEMAGFMNGLLKDSDSIDTTKKILGDNINTISKEAEQIIKEKGYEYPVEVMLEKTYFPIKQYGDCTFPAGQYEALRILIGEGGGKNWWCVLYPNLCYIDGTHAVAGTEEKKSLQKALTEDEYASITQAPKNAIRPKLKIVEFIKDLWQ